MMKRIHVYATLLPMGDSAYDVIKVGIGVSTSRAIAAQTYFIHPVRLLARWESGDEKAALARAKEFTVRCGLNWQRELFECLDIIRHPRDFCAQISIALGMLPYEYNWDLPLPALYFK